MAPPRPARSELFVVLVPALAEELLLQAVDTLALALVPEAAREECLRVAAVLLPNVPGSAHGFEEVVGADLVPILATRQVNVEALRDLLALHALAAVHDVSQLVLPHRGTVVHGVLRSVVRLDGAVHVLDRVHAGRVVAAARRRQAALEALLEVLPPGGEGVDLHGVDVDGPRDGGIIRVLGARLHQRPLHKRRGWAHGHELVDTADCARPLADRALPLAASCGQEAGRLLLGIVLAWAVILLEARAIGVHEGCDVLAHVLSRCGSVLAEDDTSELPLHVRLDLRVRAAQPLGVSEVWHDDLTVELQHAVLEARDLAVVAVALGHVPHGTHTGGHEAKNGASSTHHCTRTGPG